MEMPHRSFSYYSTNTVLFKFLNPNIEMDSQEPPIYPRLIVNRAASKDEWENKNRRALHAIQLSCGKALGQIRNFKTAKEEWKHLKTSFSKDMKAHHVSGQTCLLDPCTRPLQIYLKKGFLEEAKLNINVAPRDIFSKSREDGRTALHVAVARTGKRRLLRMQDKKGYTALALAAKLTDNKEMAEWKSSQSRRRN
ncbi:uncharacterized protein [Glycine max]|uniref:uncharacterized protein n=1 Tax=Glycine max TaxID=3847 RepID=UPI0003DEC453|nr:uncharacterized protein LOC102668991 [Glycine max]|eukprot:XP_006588342.1 uncharacterized protein LOC102668991 [Glycine max]